MRHIGHICAQIRTRRLARIFRAAELFGQAGGHGYLHALPARHIEYVRRVKAVDIEPLGQIERGKGLPVYAHFVFLRHEIGVPAHENLGICVCVHAHVARRAGIFGDIDDGDVHRAAIGIESEIVQSLLFSAQRRCLDAALPGRGLALLEGELFPVPGDGAHPFRLGEGEGDPLSFPLGIDDISRARKLARLGKPDHPLGHEDGVRSRRAVLELRFELDRRAERELLQIRLRQRHAQAVRGERIAEPVTVFTERLHAFHFFIKRQFERKIAFGIIRIARRRDVFRLFENLPDRLLGIEQHLLIGDLGQSYRALARSGSRAFVARGERRDRHAQRPFPVFEREVGEHIARFLRVLAHKLAPRTRVRHLDVVRARALDRVPDRRVSAVAPHHGRTELGRAHDLIAGGESECAYERADDEENEKALFHEYIITCRRRYFSASARFLPNNYGGRGRSGIKNGK